MAEIHVERKKSSFRLAWLLIVVIAIAIVAGLWYAGVIHLSSAASTTHGLAVLEQGGRYVA